MPQAVDHMRRCFDLARQALPHCRPNPAVGCVLVRAGAVVGEGHTQIAGREHAEIMALQQAGEAARGATAYVSFEPCAHHGRTGPCAEALIRAGVERVVYALEDPNPLVNGKGLAMLRAAGIVVEGPVLAAEAELINPGFNKRMRSGLPYVRIKMAMSLDGRTAMQSGESRWITGPKARADVQVLRAGSCAVLSGVNTILHDDASLNVRLPEFTGKQPLRVILDSQLRIPPAAATLQLPGEVVVVCVQPDARKSAALRAACAAAGQTQLTIHECSTDGKQIDLPRLFAWLAREKQCNEVLVEAGATLGGALIRAGLGDELVVYVAPSLLGNEARPLVELAGLQRLSERIRLEFLDVAMVGKDCRMRSRILKAD
jgi:diaminohydroxyphosphoribosylaminopyrimidine deaminase/5-amino-6-(5-phosphoribosylamino)uracil reductase